MHWVLTKKSCLLKDIDRETISSKHEEWFKAVTLVIKNFKTPNESLNLDSRICKDRF